MPEIIGKAPCPECGSVQEVKSDKRKYYISCTECRTFTNYQSLPAKERIRNKMQKFASKETEAATKPESIQTNIEPEETKRPAPKPVKAVEGGGVFSRISSAYANMFDE